MNIDTIVSSVLNKITKEKETDVITAWNCAKLLLGAVKRVEMDLRKEIVETNFKDAKLGTTTIDVGVRQLKFTKSLDYKVNEDELAVMADKLEKAFIDVGNLMQVKHTLNVKEYKALSPEDQNLVNNCITITESAPKLEIK